MATSRRITGKAAYQHGRGYSRHGVTESGGDPTPTEGSRDGNAQESGDGAKTFAHRTRCCPRRFAGDSAFHLDAVSRITSRTRSGPSAIAVGSAVLHRDSGQIETLAAAGAALLVARRPPRAYKDRQGGVSQRVEACKSNESLPCSPLYRSRGSLARTRQRAGICDSWASTRQRRLWLDEHVPAR